MLTVCTSSWLQALPNSWRWLMAAISSARTMASPTHRYECVMRRYGEMVAAICWSYANVREDFEDLRQDACMNIYRGLSQYRGEAELKTWIYRVTLNTCITSIRRRKRREVSSASLNATD